MGTNYYVATNRCECCKRFDEEVHIGKKSYGWAFSFRGYREHPTKLTSWREWKEYLRYKEIVDEYGDTVDYQWFCGLVEAAGAPGHTRQEDEHQNLVHNEEGRKKGWFNSEYDWDDEDGYSFSGREFM